MSPRPCQMLPNPPIDWSHLAHTAQDRYKVVERQTLSTPTVFVAKWKSTGLASRNYHAASCEPLPLGLQRLIEANCSANGRALSPPDLPLLGVRAAAFRVPRPVLDP